ncbi:MAG: TIGR02444 family protein [Chromatiales bacterium]|jgi:uncharacterized protein (TIGR02444 family)|nr:TIGR02444 family protein [Chromatiales bacterium]
MSAEQFWAYSLSVYESGEVRTTLLALQDSHGLDVNLLLFCCWQAHQGVVIDAKTLNTLSTALTPWRTRVTQPLRAARRALKSNTFVGLERETQALRQQVLDVELCSEQVGQRVLVAAWEATRRPMSTPLPQPLLATFEILCGSLRADPVAAMALLRNLAKHVEPPPGVRPQRSTKACSSPAN